MVKVAKFKQSEVIQSVVGRANASKKNGALGMLNNPYVFLTCLFASLGQSSDNPARRPVC